MGIVELVGALVIVLAILLGFVFVLCLFFPGQAAKIF